MKHEYPAKLELCTGEFAHSQIDMEDFLELLDLFILCVCFYRSHRSNPQSFDSTFKYSTVASCPSFSMSKPKQNMMILRSENFWFDDGNIILEAESQQFRIHRGMLSRHSNTFKDMLNVPQLSKEPTIEG